MTGPAEAHGSRYARGNMVVDQVRLASRPLLFVLAAAAWLCVVGSCTVWAQGSLSGANSLSLALSDLDFSTLSLTESLTVTYRYDRVSASSRTSFGLTGLTSQNLRLSAPMGELNLQGSLSFTAVDFSRASLSLSGSWDGLSHTTTLLVGNVGTSQTPSVAAGMTFRASGAIEGLGRLTLVMGLGASPSGQLVEGCDLVYAGMRVSWSDLDFCGGTAGVDLSFGCEGVESERLSWTYPLPFCDFQLRLSSSYVDLLEFQGVTASVAGGLWEARTSETLAFDQDYAFTRGSWSVSGPFFGGNMSSSVSYDSASILSQSFTWSRNFETWSLTLSPAFEIVSFDWKTMVFDIPSLRATIRWDLACCLGVEGIDLGDLVGNWTVSRGGFDQVSFSYTVAF